MRRIEDMGLVLDQLSVLHRKHWEESGEEGEFNFQYGTLKMLWQQNMVRSYGLFDGDRLVGHATCYVLPDMRTGELGAEDQALYVLPEYRSGYGAALWQFGMRHLQKEGVGEIAMTAEVENQVGLLATKMGFKHVANRYIKRLNQRTMHEQAKSATGT
jgi:ribosomal protein S18 acetylase RimI-like enzyme